MQFKGTVVLSLNETNPNFVAITILELKNKTP